MVKMKEFLYSKKPILLICKYVVFAVISMITNLGSQYIVSNLFENFAGLFIALIVGTGLGLVVKYVLDKRYIFFFTAGTTVKNIRTFILYTTMGLVTTGIFWGMELMFHFILETDNAKYWGGFLGLLIGYSIKYLLDRKLVFQVRGE